MTASSEVRAKRLPNAPSSQGGWSSRLREARLATGKSLSELAQDLCIPKPTMSRYELGDAEPSFGTLAVLCAYFSISPNWLFYGVDDDTPKLLEKGAERGVRLQRREP